MLETKRCTIRPLQKSDYMDVKALYINEEVRRYLGGVVPEQYIELGFEDSLRANQDGLNGVIREKETNYFIGLVSLNLHHDGAFYEVSYQLLPSWWGNGYATEAVQCVIEYAFNELKLPKIIAETQTANASSIRLLEKLGMTFEKTLVRFEAEQAIYSIEVFN